MLALLSPRPRSAPRRPKKDQNRSPPRFWASEGLREASGSHFGAIVGASGEHLRTMFGRYSKQFRPHARGRLLLSLGSSCAPFCFVFLGTSGLSACMLFKGSRRSRRKARRETARKHAKRSQLKPPGEAAQRPSKGINNRIGLPFGSSRCSCRSCGAAPRGAGALALPVLAALAARAFLAVLAAPAVNALPVLR